MKKLPHGKIFAVPLPDGTYVFGRVMLDVYGVYKRRLLPADSALPLFGPTYLVEMYVGVYPTTEFQPSPLLIPGAYIDPREIGKSWPIVGEKAVDPKTVEFPEGLVGFIHNEGEVAFCCGEIHLPIPMVQNVVGTEVEYFFPSDKVGIRVRIGRQPPLYWPYMCLWAMGRRSEIPPEWKGVTLAHSCLRFTPYRAKIYEHLPFPMEMSYFEKQQYLGYSLERLYEL